MVKFPAKPTHQPPGQPAAELKDQLFDPLLFLRGLAAVAVIFYHAIPSARDFRGDEWTWWLLPSGSLWVYVFFLLSGYLIGKSFWTDRYELTAKGILKFYERRALRILPLYYVSVFLVGLFGWPWIFESQNRSVLIDVLTFNYSIIEPLSPFDNSFWSLSTELQFYLFAPLLCWLFLKGVRNARVAGGLVFFFIMGLWFFKSKTFHYRFDVLGYDQQVFVNEFYTPLLMNLDVFLSGIFLNWLVSVTKTGLARRENQLDGVVGTKRPAVSPYLRFLAGVILFNVYLVSTRIEFDFLRSRTLVDSLPWIVWQPLFVILGAGAFIVLMESTPSSQDEEVRPTTRSFRTVSGFLWSLFLKAFETCGRYGYGIYLWHGVSIHWSEDLLKGIESPLFRFLAIALTAVLFAFLVGATLERLLQRWFGAASGAKASL